jgi:DNA polymerase III subunit epsilon
MKLTRPICCIDIEATGLDIVLDRIIEFAVVVMNPDGTRSTWQQRFQPGFPIPPESTAIHGITDEDVKDCPAFEDWATRIHAALKGKDLAGYNLHRFDLPILDEHLRRSGLKLDLSEVNVIDAYGIFANKEGRKLEDAVRKFCGREHEDAHGALSDATATADVLAGQLECYPDLKDMDLATLAAFSRVHSDDGRTSVDLAGKLYRDKDGDVRYAFGKARDRKVSQDPGFGQWILRQCNPPFPGSTVEALQSEFERLGEM